MYSSERSSGLARSESLHFQDDLILVLGLLDQVEIILRIGVAQQVQDARFGNAVGAGLIAPDINFQIGRVVKIVRRDGRKSGILPKPRHEFLRHVVDLLRVHAGKRVGVLPLVLVGRARADVQDRHGP